MGLFLFWYLFPINVSFRHKPSHPLSPILIRILYLWDVLKRRYIWLAKTVRYCDKRTRRGQKPLGTCAFRQQPPASTRKRLAVSSFRRRRRLRLWRPSPISRSPLRPNQRLPEPSRPTHPNSATPGRLRPSASSTGGAATTENGREAAERDRKSAAASGGIVKIGIVRSIDSQIELAPTQVRSAP